MKQYEIKLKAAGLDEMAAKVERLEELIGEAKALAGELASHEVRVEQESVRDCPQP